MALVALVAGACLDSALAALAGVPADGQDADPIATGVAPVGRLPKGFTEENAKVNSVRINYQVGGSGPVVVLLHGYTQPSHMWFPLMPFLATSHTVIAPVAAQKFTARTR